jgi:hypothetical protein
MIPTSIFGFGLTRAKLQCREVLTIPERAMEVLVGRACEDAFESLA